VRAPGLLLVAALGGCAAPPPDPVPVAPASSSRGVLRYDAAPADGSARVVQAPEWRVGDRFVFRRGRYAIETRVASADEQGYRLRDEKAGIELLLGRDLSERGQELVGKAASRITISPGDPREHWPLFVGKRWEAELELAVPNEPPRQIRVSYECDADETIRVPAGELRCLRIWRRSRAPEGDGTTETTSVHWYSPDVGHFVKRLENGILLELEKAERAAR